MGAMENKSLNIFNSKLVLADAETATDAELERIESVIAHEYFTTGAATASPAGIGSSFRSKRA